MADEKKTYLVNIESNLDQYAKEADEARKRIDELTKENIKLKGSGTATTIEIEKSNAALKVAQKDYRDSQKLVETFTKALGSETNSRKQLGEVLKLQQQALGKLGDGYIRDEKGMIRINPLYAEQTRRILETKQAIITLDKAQLDGRSSVGLYSEAIKSSLGDMQMMPGALGQAANGVQRLGIAFKALLANPIVLVISAVIGVIAGLVKAFKNSQPLMDAFHKVSAAISATFKVLLDRATDFVEFLGSIFSKELRESRKEAKLLNDELIGIEDTMTRKEKREIRRANRKGLFEEIKEEAKAAGELSTAENKLEDAEIAWIQREAELRRQIEELINSTKDENLTNREKLKNLDNAIAKTEELTKKEVEFAKERARISQEQVDQGKATREELRQNEELQAAAAEAEARGLKEQKRILSEQYTLIQKINIEEAAAALQVAKDAATAEIERVRALVNEKKLIAVQVAKETGFDVLQVQKQYAAAEVEIAKLTNDEKLALASNFAGNLATIFGENSAIGKAAAIAQTTIDTYTASMAAYKALAGIPVIGPGLGITAAAAAIAQGIATVKKIIEVKSGLPGDTGKGVAPTIISASIPRSFASTVGSTIFTQPQLSQSQLNTLPSQPILTVEDIAKALSKMPPPIVTVEDINAKAASKRKIEVRANI